MTWCDSCTVMDAESSDPALADIFLNPRNQRRAPIPRHREIPDSLAKIILKQLDLGNP